MTRMRDRARQCDSKRQYARRGAARLALRRMQTDPWVDARGISVYKCPHCQWYHVGHTPRAEQ